jgi:hypothetical protein
MQYAHNDRVISIDRRSLSGVIMRADVKNKLLTRLSLLRPLGKTADEIKVCYVKMLEAGGVYKASKFKKAVKELYDVDCGELDDKIIDMAHEKSVKLEEIEGALFPTIEHQQKIDTEAATSRPSGEVSDKPVKFSFINQLALLDKYVTAKRKAAKDDDDEDGTKEKFMELLESGVSGEQKEDPESEEMGAIVPAGVEVLEVGGPVQGKENIKNVSININTDPDSGQIKVYMNGSLDKLFGSMEEAMEWASKVSQIFNNVLDSTSDVAAGLKMSDMSRLAAEYNAVVSYMAKIATFSHNMKEMLELAHDIA